MRTTVFLSSDEDMNFGKARELGLSHFPAERFRHALFEVPFEIEVDEDTGEVEIIKVDGKKLVAG